MQRVEMVYDGDQPKRTAKPDTGRKKLPYLEAFEVTGNTPKPQLPTINGWNLMRARLIELGEMESK